MLVDSGSRLAHFSSFVSLGVFGRRGYYDPPYPKVPNSAPPNIENGTNFPVK
jgi:hypothetical protein